MDFNPYRGRRVAILGASGFVGRWIARMLTTAGAEVSLFVRDRHNTERIFNEFSVGGETIEADLLQPGEFAQHCQRLQPAIVFNLAVHGVAPDQRDAAIAHRMNAELPGEIALAVSRHRDVSWLGQALVHAGSALEYGTARGDLREETSESPGTLYGITKLQGTRAVGAICAETGLRAVTARMFMLYGPGERSGRLLPSLIQRSRTREPLDLTSGTQRRDFTYVADAAEGLLRLGLVPTPTGGPVNVATGTLTTVRDFVETAAGILQLPKELLRFGRIPTRVEEMEHLAINVDRLRQLTLWTPQTMISEGVKNTLSFLGLEAG